MSKNVNNFKIGNNSAADLVRCSRSEAVLGYVGMVSGSSLGQIEINQSSTLIAALLGTAERHDHE